MTWLIIGALILVLAIGGVLATWVTGLFRAGRDAAQKLGQPTPESARVIIDAAGNVAMSEAQRKAQETMHAKPDAIDRRVDELRARGRAGK